MIAYFDTSAIVKLYVNERYSAQARENQERISAICTSRVAYPETLAVLAKINRVNRISSEVFGELKRQFITQWPDFVARDFDNIPTIPCS